MGEQNSTNRPKIGFENGKLRAKTYGENQFIKIHRDQNVSSPCESVPVAGQMEEVDGVSTKYGQGREGTAKVQENDVVHIEWETEAGDSEHRFYLIEEMELVELEDPREADHKLLWRHQSIRRAVFYGLGVFEGKPAYPVPDDEFPQGNH
ncbi:hypothetical protein [Halorubellus sp. PRR65]|uniref:hypothetical protein n=1 Tax=Halorubellus sp. PRR65 TaxID=3098148 RepID=UPI002B259BE0|nr:hypothetical protein [Halorubellus sp. PRR65]